MKKLNFKRRLLIAYLYIFKKTAFFNLKDHEDDKVILYGFLGISVLFLFETIQLSSLSGSLRYALLCFASAIPFIVFTILALEFVPSKSEKVRIPIIGALTFIIGIFFIISGIVFVIFDKSFWIGLIFLILIVLLVLSLFIYDANLKSMVKESLVKKDDVHKVWDKPIGSFANELIEMYKDKALGVWDLIHLIIINSLDTYELLYSFYLLKKGNVIDDNKFMEVKATLIDKDINEEGFKELESEVSRLLHDLPPRK